MTHLHYSVLLLLLLLSPTLLVGISAGSKVVPEDANIRPAAQVHLTCNDNTAPSAYKKKICGATAIGKNALVSEPSCFAPFLGRNLQSNTMMCKNTTIVFTFALDMRDKNIDIYKVSTFLLFDKEKYGLKYGAFLYTNDTIPDRYVVKPRAWAPPKGYNWRVFITGWGEKITGAYSYERMETKIDMKTYKATKECVDSRKPKYLHLSNYKCGFPDRGDPHGGMACKFDFGGPVYQDVDSKFLFVGWVHSGATCEVTGYDRINGVVAFTKDFVEFIENYSTPTEAVRRENTLLGSPAPSLFFFPLPLVSLALVQFFFW